MSSPEHKVQCHEAARKLRAAGKPIWKDTIDFSSFFKAESISIYEKAGVVATILKRKYPNKIDFNHKDYNHTIANAFEEFEELSKCSGTEADEEADTNEFDYTLNQLYNWADYNRVWVKTIL